MDEETIIAVLETNLANIQADLGNQWPDFIHRLASTKERFRTVRNRDDLVMAVNILFQVCLEYDAVKKVLRDFREREISEIRKPEPKPRKKTELQGIVQRYIRLIQQTQIDNGEDQ